MQTLQIKVAARAALAALALGGGAIMATPVMAQSTVPQPVCDRRVRDVIFNEREVVRVVTAFRSATQIQFDAGETVQFVALGDTISWEVAPAGSTLFLKPRENAGSTNLMVITQGPLGSRTYTFELTPVRRASSEGYFTVRFRYPQQEAQMAALAEQQAQLQRVLAMQNSTIRMALDGAVLEGQRNLNYQVQGASLIQPSEVSDNGQFTVLRYPNAREMPAVFVVEADGSESTADFDVRDDFIVVHGVYRELRVRRGRSVLCIYNMNFDPNAGRDPMTDTASEHVRRTTGGEND